VSSGLEITPGDLAVRLARGEAVFLLDVREEDERALCAIEPSVLVPLSRFRGPAISAVRPPAGALVVCYCHHGVRSLAAAQFLRARGIAPGAVSLEGGIDLWARRVDPTVPRY
jgi:rhodanese-related sulfurtransferase